MTFWPSSTPAPGNNLRADPDLARQYEAAGWWGSRTLSDLVAQHAGSPELGGAWAFIEADRRLSWGNYHLLAGQLAGLLGELGLRHTDRLVAFLPDSSVQHVVYLAAERAGVIVVGVGHRAGEAELSHLVGHCGATAFVSLLPAEKAAATKGAATETTATFQRLAQQHPSLSQHLQIADITDSQGQITGLEVFANTDRLQLMAVEARTDTTATATPTAAATPFPHQLGPNELFFLNSTSGTTGLPKCVMQTQNRWFYFHQLAKQYGQLSSADVFAVAVPAPFGFGLWTTHFTPAILGAPAIIMRRFSPELLASLIAQEQATVLCAVTTQFIMLLNSPELAKHDLSSLRVMFTGGEAIPPHRAQQFEAQTGAALLNFYGSNETGVLTGTKSSDSQTVRLTTGGRAVPEMNVRLYPLDPGSSSNTDSQPPTAEPLPELAGEGQPACRGPALALGYYNDDPANRKLFTYDGWMLMGDAVRFEDGCLQVIGRTSDFIIRGGKNISAPAVEAQVVTHPAVSLAAAVAAPDEVFGEKVAICVELYSGASLTLEELVEHLLGLGVSKEWLPEHFFVFDTLPRASGGKVAKGELRAEIARRFS